jgi:diacylglycerol kinase (ATP)
MIHMNKLIKSFGHAFEGLEHAYNRDQNLRIHFFVGTIVVVVSIILKVNPFEMGILGVMILLVMVTEMINTAIERMVDLITKEHREDAKIAKDVAAGMVFLTAIGSLIVGFLIFLPHILKLFK